jgi:hypothetical protein
MNVPLSRLYGMTPQLLKSYNNGGDFDTGDLNLNHPDPADLMASLDPVVARFYSSRFDLNQFIPREEVDSYLRLWSKTVPIFNPIITGRYRRGYSKFHIINAVSLADPQEVEKTLPMVPDSPYVDTTYTYRGQIVGRQINYLLNSFGTARHLRVIYTSLDFYYVWMLVTTGSKNFVRSTEKVANGLGYTLHFDDASPYRQISELDVRSESEIFRILDVDVVRPKDREHLLESDFTSRNLTQLVCKTLAPEACHALSEQIVRNLLRVSATRIFSNPFQSIMEPIANAIDAYGVTESIGKFGVGFLSLLYWPMTNSGSVNIISKYGPEKYMGVYFQNYGGRDNDLNIEFYDLLDPDRIIKDFYVRELYPDDVKSGVTVILGYFGEDVEKFDDQIQRFTTMTRVPVIVVNTADEFKAARQNMTPDHPVVIVLKASSAIPEYGLFAIYDRAIGMTPDVLLNSLIIPTSSTKGITTRPPIGSIHATTQIRLPGLPNSRISLLITVGDVIIVNLNLNKAGPVYVVSFPSQTPLPVSRDDILLTPDILDSLKAAIRELIQGCIHYNYNLQNLIELVHAYTQYTDQLAALKLIPAAREFILAYPNLVLLPSAKIVELLQHRVTTPLAYLKDVNLIESRRRLDAIIDDFSPGGYDTFENVRVVQLEGLTEVTDAGIPGYLFTGVIDDYGPIVDSYPGAILRPLGDNARHTFNFNEIYPGSRNYPLTGIIVENRNDPIFPHSIAIYNNQPFAQPATIKLWSPYNMESIPILHPSTNLNFDLIVMGKDEKFYANLYYAIEAWIMNLGRNIIINVADAGSIINQRDYNFTLVNFDIPFEVKRETVRIIFMQCLIAIQSFARILGSEAVHEYIITLTQFFTQIKILVTPGASRIFWIGRLTPHGWIDTSNPKVTRPLPRSHNQFFMERVWIDDATVRKFQDGFFASLRRNLDDDLYLKDDIYLLDPRYFPNIAVENFDLTMYNLMSTTRSQVHQVIIDAPTGFMATLIVDTYTQFVLRTQDPELLSFFISIVSQNQELRQLNTMMIEEINRRFPITFFTQYLSEVPNPENIAWIRNTVYFPLTEAVKLYVQHRHHRLTCTPPQFPSHSISTSSGVRYAHSSSSGSSLVSSVSASGHPSSLVSSTSASGLTPQVTPQVLQTFTLSQLIQYVFAKNVVLSRPEDFIRLGEAINNYQSFDGDDTISRLQMLQIAVTAGTTKSFVASVLTELLQNSLDAIRQSTNNNPKIIEVKFCITDRVFDLTVQDYEGIPFSAWLSLLIPFLSSKRDQLSTGEMGTGLFNVYRRPTQEVTFRSGPIMIVARPMWEGDQILDLDYVFYRIDPFPGTNIWIHSLPLNESEMTEIDLDVNIFAQQYAGNLEHPVMWEINGTKIDGTPTPKNVIFTSPVGTVSITQSDTPHQSILLTNHTPFSLLVPFLTNMFGSVTNGLLSTNIVVNINKGYYLPVQSRNRISVGGDNPLALEIFLESGLNMATFAKLLNEDDAVFERYLPGATSKVSMDQFAISSFRSGFHTFGPTESKMTNWSAYLITPTGFTYGQIMNFIIKAYHQELTTPSDELTQRYAIQGQDDEFVQLYVGSPFDLVMQRWFRGKLAAKFENVKVSSIKAVFMVESSSGGSIKITPEGLLLGIFQKFVDLYYVIGNRLTWEGLTWGQPPEVFLGNTGDTNLAIYAGTEHRIIVNMIYLEGKYEQLIQEWDHYLELHHQGDGVGARLYISTSQVTNYLGNGANVAATLPHEILHALTRSEHATAAHAPISFKLGDKEYQNLPYDEVSFQIYTHILQHGFLDLWT